MFCGLGACVRLSSVYGTAHFFGSVLSVRGLEAVGEQLTVTKSSKMQDDLSKLWLLSRPRRRFHYLCRLVSKLWL
jgi:hypothetical protein